MNRLVPVGDFEIAIITLFIAVGYTIICIFMLLEELKNWVVMRIY